MAILPVVHVTVPVGVGNGVLLVGGSVATSVGVKSPVASTVLLMLVVLSSVEMYGMYVWSSMLTRCATVRGCAVGLLITVGMKSYAVILVMQLCGFLRNCIFKNCIFYS